MDALFDPHSCWWNTHLTDLCFYPPKAQQIKSIPICSIPQSDVLIWLKERIGIYSVKMGYQALCEGSTQIHVPTQNAEAKKSFWKGIWKLKVPSKIKHFMWKPCPNALPTKANL